MGSGFDGIRSGRADEVELLPGGDGEDDDEIGIFILEGVAERPGGIHAGSSEVRGDETDGSHRFGSGEQAVGSGGGEVLLVDDFVDLGEVEQWLPEAEAVRLMNDKEARCRLFRMHFPSATVIDRDQVSIELHERR